MAAENGDSSTPYVELGRSDWAELAQNTRLPLLETEIVQLRGLGDPLDMREVEEVYLPLSRLLNLYVGGTKQLHRATSDFLGERAQSTPFVIGVAGSVAVGKSTIARLLRELLSRWDDTPRVELVTTDGFLLPNAELERRGLMERKGFPESYDRRSLLRFVYMYLLRLGFLDGWQGYTYCRMLAIYEYMIELKVMEIERRERGLSV